MNAVAWVSLGSSLLLASIAFFGTQYWNYRYRPKLEMDFEPSAPDCIKTKAGGPSFRDVYYVQFRVRNSGRKHAAENVEVILKDVYKKEREEDDFERVDSFNPLNLRWSFIESDKLPERTYLPFLSKDVEKRCTLGHIMKPKREGDIPLKFLNEPTLEEKGAPFEKTAFDLDTVVLPFF